MRHSQETKDAAAKMRAANVPEVHIAAALGVNRSTLRAWHDETYRERRKAVDTKRYEGPKRKAERARKKDRNRKQVKYENDPDFRLGELERAAARRKKRQREDSPTTGETRGDFQVSKSVEEEKLF